MKNISATDFILRIVVISSMFICFSLNAGAIRPVSLRVEINEPRSVAVFSLELHSCRQRIAFDEGYPGERKELWKGLDGYVWEGNTLKSADDACLRTVRFSVSTEELEIDRTYPLIISSSFGYAIYLSHVLPIDTGTVVADVLITSRSCATHTYKGACRLQRRISKQEWANEQPYLVTADISRSGPGIGVIPEDDVPEWVVKEVAAYASDAYSTASALLGKPKGEQIPTFVLYQPDVRETTWRGWSSGGSLFLLLRGKSWSTKTAALDEILDNFVTHEVLHLWNAWTYNPIDNTPSWLTEGFAEYLSISLRAAHGRIEASKAAGRILHHIERCLSALEDPGKSHSTLRAGQTVYDCGVTAQWVIESSYENEQQDIWYIWRRIFSKHPRGFYSLEDIKKDSKSDGLNWLSNEGDPEALRRTLAALGAVAGPDTNSPEAKKSQAAAIYTHLLRQTCDAPPYGFYQNEGYVVLDTGTRCGSLNGSPQAVGINGINIETGDVSKALALLQELCSRKKEVQVNLTNAPPRSVRCTQTFAPPPPSTVISCVAGGVDCAVPMRARTGGVTRKVR